MSQLDKIKCQRLIQAISITMVPDVELSFEEFIKESYDRVYWEVRTLLVAHFISEITEEVLAYFVSKWSLDSTKSEQIRKLCRSYLSGVSSGEMCTIITVYSVYDGITVGSHYDLSESRRNKVVQDTKDYVMNYYADF